MVALEVPENLLIKRILKRGETSGRPDDQNEIKIRNRFNEYKMKTAILQEFYQKQNMESLLQLCYYRELLFHLFFQL